MSADTPPLAILIDAQGHRVTASVTRSGLLAVITQTPAEGRESGHPCLNLANVVELRDAFNAYIAGCPS